MTSDPKDGPHRSSVERTLVEAIHTQSLDSAVSSLLTRDDLSSTDRHLVEAAAGASHSLTSAQDELATDVKSALDGIGIQSTRVEKRPPLSVQVEFRVSPEDVGRAGAALEPLGFRFEHTEGFRYDETTVAGQRVRRLNPQPVMLLRRGEITSRVLLSWTDYAEPPLWKRLLTPGSFEVELVPLPTALWRLYHLLRPLRPLLKRIPGLRPSTDLGYFLGTTTSTLPHLFDLVGLTPEDRFVDVGCGDGRVVLQAVESVGCHGLGIELNPQLVDIARSAAEERDLTERTRFIAADATEVDLSEATVVFLFLPVNALAFVLPKLIRSLPAGTKILAHEQAPLPPGLPPTPPIPVFADRDVTIAYLWTAAG